MAPSPRYKTFDLLVPMIVTRGPVAAPENILWGRGHWEGKMLFWGGKNPNKNAENGWFFPVFSFDWRVSRRAEHWQGGECPLMPPWCHHCRSPCRPAPQFIIHVMSSIKHNSSIYHLCILNQTGSLPHYCVALHWHKRILPNVK